MFASDLFLIGRYANNVPRLDDWFIVPALTGNQPITLAYLWSQHNEHRLPLPRLILLGLAHISNSDFRAGMYFNACALAALAAGMVYTAGRIRGRTTPCDAFFPIVLLNWGHVENLLWGWQLGFVLSSTIAGALLIAIASMRNNPKAGEALMTGSFLLLLPLCGANSLLLVPPLGLWMAATGLAMVRSKEEQDRHVGWIFLTFAIAVGALFASYFVGYQSPRMYARPDIWHCLQTSLQFLSTAFGIVDPSWWVIGATMVVAAMLLAALALLGRWRGHPGERIRIVGLLCFLAATVMLALGLGWGRAGCPGPMGLSWRYVTLSVPGICAAYLGLVLCGGQFWANIGQVVLFAIAITSLWHNTQLGLMHARGLQNLTHQFETDARFLPPLILVDSYQRTSIPPDPLDNKADWIPLLTMLHRAGIGCFRQMPEDPQYRVLTINGSNSKNLGPHRFQLNAPQHVYAIRVLYSYPASPERAVLVAKWRSPKGAEATFSRELPREGREDSALIWVDAPIEEFAVYPDVRHLPPAGPESDDVKEMQLLVPESTIKTGI
jgi:hypothetical protein